MKMFSGIIHEIKITANHQRQAVISCPEKYYPLPGQYLQAYPPANHETALAISLFPSEYRLNDEMFVTSSPIPLNWQPGTILNLRGPLGKGFKIAESVNRLGLIALGETPERLLALAQQALQQNIEVALFTDSVLPQLSTLIEANPISAAENAYQWADMIAIDTPPYPIEQILNLIGASSGNPFSCPTQVLVHIPMPCGGVGECGVCSITDEKNKSLLVCEDGPVFILTSTGFRKNQ